MLTATDKTTLLDHILEFARRRAPGEEIDRWHDSLTDEEQAFVADKAEQIGVLIGEAFTQVEAVFNTEVAERLTPVMQQTYALLEREGLVPAIR